MIQIEKDIPAPTTPPRERGLPDWYPETRGCKGFYPWDSLKVGDSFFVPHRTTGDFGGAMGHARRSRPSWKLTARTVTENGVQGVRVWRVK